MPQRTIAPSEWKAFFESFSFAHERWLARIQRRSPDGALQTLADAVPLHSVELDDTHTLRVVAGKATEHTIRLPGVVAVSFHTCDDGLHVGLDVATGDQAITMIRFRSPALAEMLNGVV